MADYFNSDHFKLLNKWKGTVYDKSNPEQQRIYEELGQAYDVTKQWAATIAMQDVAAGRRVKVDLGRAKGKVTIEFASLDDLQRIVDVIEQAPGS